MVQRSARNTAMDLLSRREHSHKQLDDKLRQRGFDQQEIETALTGLAAENLLNDERFAESYVHQRMQKGFGPLRIRHELYEKGIPPEIIEIQMENCTDQWIQMMQQQRIKKFGADLPQEYKEITKQARFLQNRGFSPESVMRLFRS